MEEKLKCNLQLSLKYMALRNVAALFWSNPDIPPSVRQLQIPVFHNRESRYKYREILRPSTREEVSKLRLPASLSKEVVDMAGAIFSEVVKWKVFFSHFIYDVKGKIRFRDAIKLCWSTVGVVDYKKTAEELLRSDLLTCLQRYKIACLLCLEDRIPLLWEELPNEFKKYFLSPKPVSPVLPFYWARTLLGQVSKPENLLPTEDRNLTSLNHWAFEDSVSCGNKTAVEYLYQKLTFAEREVSLVRTAESLLAELEADRFQMERFSSVLCYLLSLMTLEQHVELLKMHPVAIFLTFSYWPWQDLFLENAKFIWPFMSPHDYDSLLRKMILRINCTGHCFPKFPDFFIQSPPSFKRHLLESRHLAYAYLSKFIESGDSEAIEAIFKSIDAADSLELVCHRDFMDLVESDRWQSCCLLEVCLQEALPTKEDRDRWREAFHEYLESRYIEWICGEKQSYLKRKLQRHVPKRIFEFLDETDASTDAEKKAPV